MQVEKTIQPNKFLEAHEAALELRAPTAIEMKRQGRFHANLFFSLDGDPKRHCLRFTEDECRRLAYLFEQAAERMAGCVISQSDDGYVINTAWGKTKAGQSEGAQP